MNMNLIEMETRFLAAARETGNIISNNSWDNRKSVGSYYKDYADAKHMQDRVMVYDFDSPANINKYLDILWPNNSEIYGCVDEILIMMRENDKHILEDVKGYNYTL